MTITITMTINVSVIIKNGSNNLNATKVHNRVNANPNSLTLIIS